MRRMRYLVRMDIGLHLIFSHILFTSECSRESGYYDLSRTKSFRVEPKNHRIFRASDLTQGELLGKGFFGQVRINCFFVIIYIHFLSWKGQLKYGNMEYLQTHMAMMTARLRLSFDSQQKIIFQNKYQQSKSLLC